MLIGRGANPLSFPTGLVLDDQLFGLQVLASHCLELQRNKQLWRLISGNTLQVGEPKYPFEETSNSLLLELKHGT